jgi:hypothetical protein
MDSSTFVGSSERPPRFAFRFSLIALLLFTTLVCVLLGWWVRPRRFIVESLFQLSASQPVPVGSSPSTFDPQEFALRRKTQVDLVRSDLVLLSALRDPTIAALPVLRSKSDPVNWLRDQLEVETSSDSQLISIRIRCAEGAVDDCRQIVDAVSDAYVKNVLFREEQQRQVRRDALSRSISQVRDELVKSIAISQAANKKADVSDPASEVAQLEIDAKQDVLRELLRELEIDKLNGLLPSRVRQVQRATSRPE